MKKKFTTGFAAAALLLVFGVPAGPAAAQGTCPSGQVPDPNAPPTYCVPAPPSSVPVTDANGNPVTYEKKNGKKPHGCQNNCQEYRNTLPGERQGKIFVIIKRGHKLYHYYPFLGGGRKFFRVS